MSLANIFHLNSNSDIAHKWLASAFNVNGLTHLMVGEQGPPPQEGGEGGDEILTWVIIILGYLFLVALGPLLFPPLIICLFVTDSNVASCTFDIFVPGGAAQNDQQGPPPQQ